jgi:ABC-2 type transport system permease protein
MRFSIIATVLRREAMEIVRNRLLVVSIVVPPVLLIAAPLLIGHFAGSSAGNDNMPPDYVARLLASRPEWASLTRAQLIAALTMQQFLAIFLIMPAYVPLSIATFSIVGEKQTHSLEAVLATPIRTAELLTGKAIAAVVPGVVTSWLAYGVLLLLGAVLLGPELARVLADGSWLAAVFLLGPVIGLLSCVAGIIVSSRVNDPRVAQQIGGVVILPIVAIVMVQAVGGYLFGPREYAIASLGLGMAGVAGIWLAARLFDRETILTRWR